LAPGKGRNLVDVFDAFLSQPKVHDLLTRVKPQGSWGESSPIGNIKSSTAAIFARRVEVNQTKSDADNIIAELFHLARMDGLYTDKQLANAARRTEYASEAANYLAPSANVFEPGYKPGGWNEQNQYGYSVYFHTNPTATLWVPSASELEVRAMNKILLAFFALSIFRLDVFAKEWRGIVPLSSTRADVERLMGKPNELGRYEVNGERADIIYSDGPCRGQFYPLEKPSCKCLVQKDTVLSIYVEPDQLKFSKVRIDKSKFTRTAIVVGNGLFSYSNVTDGIVYTVDEVQDEVIDVEYLPSFADCQLVTTMTATPRNSWRGLIPLHSNRQVVEALLGPPSRSWERAHSYDAENEIVTVKYSKGKCDEPGTEWN
jgi:hypothetical protein